MERMLQCEKIAGKVTTAGFFAGNCQLVGDYVPVLHVVGSNFYITIDLTLAWHSLKREPMGGWYLLERLI